MLFFLVSIVLKDYLEFRVFACISTLVVPINGVQAASMHIGVYRRGLVAAVYLDAFLGAG